MAVYCWVDGDPNTWIVALVGVIAILDSVGDTVRVAVLLVTPLKVAVMELLPVATPVAKPAELMVATDVLEELHVTLLVISAVDESEYVPVAVYCCVADTAAVAVAGVTAILDKVVQVIVSAVALVLLMVPEDAPENEQVCGDDVSVAEYDAPADNWLPE